MVQKLYCERHLSIQSMLGKKEKNTNISIFWTTPTYLKQTFVCFFFPFFSMNLSLILCPQCPAPRQAQARDNPTQRGRRCQTRAILIHLAHSHQSFVHPAKYFSNLFPENLVFYKMVCAAGGRWVRDKQCLVCGVLLPIGSQAGASVLKRF